MSEMRPIIFGEDNPRDAKLIMESLAGSKLSDRVILVEDGVEAMQYRRYARSGPSWGF